ncbi:MAG: NAD(P)-dependent glycerol-3-phosphate dehydrogenase [Pseudomonadota bacterium]|nr:NAD(P)-dependent glycerol-3-phosphate dehydrogenase [Pseudomonadota bacterium]
MNFQTIGIVAPGAWGTALALAIARAGRDVLLWARDPDLVRQMQTRRENTRYLPGIPLEGRIRITDSLKDLAGADVVLLVTPAQVVRETCRALRPVLADTVPVILCAKGIELGTGKLLSEVTAEELSGHSVATLSGPTFATEVARGLPTAVTLACADPALGQALAAALGSPVFRPYVCTDVIGAEVGGAVKNVLAIASGIVEGKGLGENARAALITRGLSEITRLATALGGRAETMMGLSGFGDIILTCTSRKSRNMSLGYEIGQGKPLKEIMAGRQGVVEGLPTAGAVMALAQRLGIDMPICAAVDTILNHGARVDETIRILLTRPFRHE